MTSVANASRASVPHLGGRHAPTGDSTPRGDEFEADADADMCPICLDADLEDGTMLTTSCSHRFCASCLRMASNRSPKCPLCRDFVHTCESLRPAACGLCRAGIQLGKKDSARNRERDRREDRLMKGYLVSVAHAPNAPATRAERASHAHL